jgi:hypothetical protein
MPIHAAVHCGNALQYRIDKSATSSYGPGDAVDGLRDQLLQESRAALDFLARSLASVELLGGSAEIRLYVDELTKELERDEVAAEVVDDERAAVVETLLGTSIFGSRVVASKMTIRVRAATEFTYRAVWADGRAEERPPDRTRELAAAVETAERELSAATEQARDLAEQLQDAGRVAAHARAQLAAAEQELAALRGRPFVAASVGARPGPLAPAPSATAPPATATSRSWLYSILARALAFWAGALAFVHRLVRRRPPPGEGTPALPLGGIARASPQKVTARLPAIERRSSLRPPATVWVEATTVGTRDHEPEYDASDPAARLDATERRVSDEIGLVATAAGDVERLETALRAAKIRAVTLAQEREQRRRELERYRDDLRSRSVARLVELTGPGAAPPAELELAWPEFPLQALVILQPCDQRPPLGRVDARLRPGPRNELFAHLERFRQERPAAIARQIAASLCICRDHILDLDRRARHAHEERESELSACRVDDVAAIRQRQRANARHPVARDAEKIVQEAADRLERHIKEVRRDWEERITSCASDEQLRAEVAAIENGAAHRLSIICDELRESMTIQFVRLALELSRPLRQELLHKRLAVARQTSPKLEETFEDIRFVLPQTVDETFSALRAPELGELMDAKRGFLDPLLRSLAREKQACIGRLAARLDEMERTTARQLFAAAVFLSPLLLTTFDGITDELIAAHERWIDGRVAEERLAYERAQVRNQPALDLLAPVEKMEAGLFRLLERFAKSVTPS